MRRQTVGEQAGFGVLADQADEGDFRAQGGSV